MTFKEWYNDNISKEGLSENTTFSRQFVKDAYEAGQAELEQWKAEWQKQVQKANDESWERTKLTGKVKELEAQIEKMKCCSNCKNYNCLCDCFNEIEQYCDKWEL